jgi:hypothetical protein
LPSKKRKQVQKKKTLPKRKAVSRVKQQSKTLSKLDPAMENYIDKANNAELRVMAKSYGVPRSGDNALNKTLRRNLKKKLREVGTPNKALVNLPQGSVTSTTYVDPDKIYNISVVDRDIEPHKEVITDQLDDMVFRIAQKPIVGGEEVTLVTLSHTDEEIKRRLKANRDKVKKDSSLKLSVISSNGNGGVQPDVYSKTKGNRILPVWDQPAGKSKLKITRKLLTEYEKKQWIPFYLPNNNKSLVGLDDFKQVKFVDYLTEKEALLPKDRGNYVVTTGQHIQTQVFDIPKGSGNFEWVGLYYQKRSKATKNNPIPTIVKAKQIRADNDDAGHFIAYINNMYAFDDPLKKNFKIEGKSNVIRPDEFKAMRFLSKSIINSLGRKRNLAIEDAIIKNLGARALKYRTDKGLRPLIISEQIVEITKLAQEQTIVARVNVADRAPIDFQVDFEEWNEATPSVKFVETGKIDESTGKIAVHSLDSDSLLKIIVRKFNIDMVSAQRMLESLHNQDWITYPRADVQKAIDAPIRIESEKKRKALESLINKQKQSGKKKETGEQLTVQEFEVLQIVYEAEKASDRKENYVKSGYWELRSGDLVLQKKDTVLASESQSYKPKLFDIVIHKKTLDENEMLDFLIENNIGKPSTRSAQIERLRNAGILTFRDGNYIIDRRGYYMVAAHNVMEKEQVPFVKDLLGEIDQVKDKDFIGLNQIVNKFEFIDRKKLAKETAIEAKTLIEAEHDLTYLESF